MPAVDIMALRARIVEMEGIHEYILRNHLVFLRMDYIIAEIKALKIRLASLEAEERTETQRLISQN